MITNQNRNTASGMLPAKLSLPRSRVWVNREHLFRRLDDLLRQPLVWISAPAGSGKTILAASFVQAHGLPVLWYNLDQGDGDPASFFYYLRLAAQQLIGPETTDLPDFTPDYLPGFQIFATRFFQELYAAFPAGLTVVLDNVQDVAKQDDFLLLLKLAVHEAPEGVNLFCLSRSDPPAGLSRLEVNGDLGRLGREDLKWQPDEAAILAREVTGQEVTADILAGIINRTEGWGAGVVLLLRSLAGQDHPSGESGLATNQTLFDYFAGEILDGLEDRERDFLLKTSCLPAVSAQLGAALTGVSGAGAILESLVEKNYFTVRLKTAEDSYRYHPLFRAFLQQQAERTFTSEEWAMLRRAAAGLLHGAGDGEAAIGLLSKAAAWPELAAIVCETAPRLLAHGRYQSVLEWLEAVPESQLNALPWLKYWKAAALMPVDYAASHDHFARAFELFMKEGEAAGSVHAWSGAVETIVHSLSKCRRLDQWLAQLDTLRRGYAVDDQPELLLGLAPPVVYIYALRSTEDPEREKWLALTKAVLDLPIDPAQKIMASFALITFFQWSGQPSRALPILKQQEAIASAPGASPLSRIVARLCKAWFCWIYGDYAECNRVIEEGLAIAEQTGVHHWTYLMLVQGLANAKMQGKIAEAERFLVRLQPCQGLAREMDRVYLHNESGWLEMLKGRPDQALFHQQAALEIAESFGSPFVIAEAAFGLSQAYQALGETEQADAALVRSRREGGRYGSQTICFQCDLVEVYYLLERGDIENAGALLARTASQAMVRGYSGFAWWLQEVVGKVCLFGLEHDIEPDFCRNLIRQFKVPPPDNGTRGEAWPWPVRIRTLGTFQVIVDEALLTFNRKTQKKPLELLKTVIAYGGNEVAVERLLEDLWPEGDGDLAQQNFKAALHRLRKLVGPETLILADGRLSLARDRCWLDLWSYETVLSRLGRSLSNPESLNTVCDQLIKLYYGDFLAGEDTAPWLIAPRERYRARFLSALEKIGDRLLSAGLADQARDCYEHGLAIDPLVEQFYRGLMRCYWFLGRPAEVQTTLNRCRQVLSANLGLTCSPVTEALALTPEPASGPDPKNS